MNSSRPAGALTDAEIVVAAQAGDERALNELVSRYLPLLYNIAGRSLRGHADVDDVVQETMLRAVRGLSAVRDPSSFRSWLVAITVRQIRTHRRTTQAVTVPLGELGPDVDLVDPAADFADVTIARLGLTGQRRQVAQATSWLDTGDQQVLTLWWLEATGELSRDEVSRALDLSAAHTAVQVQRMKATLEVARTVVGALSANPRCPALEEVVRRWDGRPSPLWRKRIARHTRQCPVCGRASSGLAPMEVLLSGLALVPVPSALGPTLTGLIGSGSAGLHTAASVTGSAATAAGAGLGHALGRLVRQIGHLLAAKPAAVVVTSAVIAGGAVGGHALYTRPPAPPASRPALVQPTPAPSTTTTTPELPTKSSPTPSPIITKPTPRPGYGLVVDRSEAAPPADQPPKTLPRRPEGTITGTGRFEDPQGGKYTMKFDGDHVTLTGQGYFWVRWQIIYTTRAGQLRMPTWTGLTGRLFHVASGGGKRMDDELPGATDPPHTGLGRPSTGYDTLPAGAQQMWQNEYYYLNGSVTLHLNETGDADYNLIVMPKTWEEITADVTAAPAPDLGGPIRYGLVRDTGKVNTPVPQYLTRKNPANPWLVPQRSRVS